MTDEGEFILNEPYKSKLEEARIKATSAWADAMYGYLEQETGIPKDELDEEFRRRVKSRKGDPLGVVDSFVIEMLETTEM